MGYGLGRLNLEKMHPDLRGKIVENHLGKLPKCTIPESNTYLPVYGSLVQHESSAFDHAATKAARLTNDDIKCDQVVHPTGGSIAGLRKGCETVIGSAPSSREFYPDPCSSLASY
uniref:Uncharacterized protein n=1 Tax=Timema tahoe TaxID=61484 RepID=A0A7R9IKK0_9NEOP|nr:unnamed protein product [Timema tahoe]